MNSICRQVEQVKIDHISLPVSRDKLQCLATYIRTNNVINKIKLSPNTNLNSQNKLIILYIYLYISVFYYANIDCLYRSNNFLYKFVIARARGCYRKHQTVWLLMATGQTAFISFFIYVWIQKYVYE